MAAVTVQAESLRRAIASNRAAVDDVLSRYSASHPRLFGSVARGDAQRDSDVDLLVDLNPSDGNVLLRVAGIGEELSRLLGVRVDVVTDALLRTAVSATAQRDAIAL